MTFLPSWDSLCSPTSVIKTCYSWTATFQKSTFFFPRTVLQDVHFTFDHNSILHLQIRPQDKSQLCLNEPRGDTLKYLKAIFLNWLIHALQKIKFKYETHWIQHELSMQCFLEPCCFTSLPITIRWKEHKWHVGIRSCNYVYACSFFYVEIKDL